MSFKPWQKFPLWVSEFWYSCTSRRSTSDLVKDWGRKDTLGQLFWVGCTLHIPLVQLWWGQADPPQTQPGSPSWSYCWCYMWWTRQQTGISLATDRLVTNLRGRHHPHTTLHPVLRTVIWHLHSKLESGEEVGAVLCFWCTLGVQVLPWAPTQEPAAEIG